MWRQAGLGGVRRGARSLTRRAMSSKALRRRLQCPPEAGRERTSGSRPAWGFPRGRYRRRSPQSHPHQPLHRAAGGASAGAVAAGGHTAPPRCGPQGGFPLTLTGCRSPAAKAQRRAGTWHCCGCRRRGRGGRHVHARAPAHPARLGQAGSSCGACLPLNGDVLPARHLQRSQVVGQQIGHPQLGLQFRGETVAQGQQVHDPQPRGIRKGRMPGDPRAKGVSWVSFHWFNFD